LMLRSLKVIFLNGKLEERIENTLAYYGERPARYRESGSCGIKVPLS